MPGWYEALLDSVATRIEGGQQRAIAAANQELLLAYWGGWPGHPRPPARAGVGREGDRPAVGRPDRPFPGGPQLLPRNLKYMRAFAAAWDLAAIVQAPLAQLPWYHHLALLEKLSDPDLRFWYAAAALEHGWSRNVLVHQIETRLHERAGKAITNFTATLPPADSDQAQQATRDPYLFDFVGNADIRRERDLERQLVAHVEKFLLELGQGFAFVGQQVRLEIGGQEFYADLLFYHLKLRRYVVIELKAAELQPGFLGQLGLYMAATDDLLAHPDDKPTIGLLLCKSKDNVVAEYALRGYAVPIGVAEWKSAITSSLPPELASSLPSIEEIEAEFADRTEESP